MTSRVRVAIRGGGRRQAGGGAGRRLGRAVAVLLACSGTLAAGTADAPDGLPTATWQRPGQIVVVEVARDPQVATRSFAALGHYAIGVAAVPVSLVQPQVALGLPLYLLIAAPWQAVFNARVDLLARVLVAEPLPDAVIRALQAQWPATQPLRPRRVTLQLAGYGLATRSGRTLEALERPEDLCLVADGRIEWLHDGSPLQAEDIAIGIQSATRDAPPPLCAPMSRWAADDGRLLRQALRELAELLAAFIADRAERRPP